MFASLPIGVLGISNSGKIQNISEHNDVAPDIPLMKLPETVKLSQNHTADNTPLDISSPTTKKPLKLETGLTEQDDIPNNPNIQNQLAKNDNASNTLGTANYHNSNKDVSEEMNMDQNVNYRLEVKDKTRKVDTHDIISKVEHIDDDRKIMKKYLHDLLTYINSTDAALNDDKDGNLIFFMDKMPESEQDISFERWALNNVTSINKTFVEEIDIKKAQMVTTYAKLSKEIQGISVDKNDQDSFLLQIAESLNIKL